VQACGVRDVERLLGLSRSTIRAFVDAGFVTPGRGPRNAWRFSFQDLIVLRAAQALVAARVPQRRITRALRELRRNLPATMPLSGLAITAVGDRVVVREGSRHWQAESGQYLLGFDADPAAGSLNVLAPEPTAAPSDDARAWFARGAALERSDPQGARRAYERSLAVDPAFVDARINLGRLLHELQQLADAERVYRAGIATSGHDPVLLFNFGVLLEDLGRRDAAIAAYEAAVRADADLADGHFNLALLYEDAGRPRDALRHMARYRTLTRRRPDR
jgi:tetratricopeptide (TPR) repeat protein